MENTDNKLIGTVKVGEKGQIVIPKNMREMFNIKPGDTLLLLADKEKGIAITDNEAYLTFANAIFSAQNITED